MARKAKKTSGFHATCPGCYDTVTAGDDPAFCQCNNLRLDPDGRAFTKQYASPGAEIIYRPERNVLVSGGAVPASNPVDGGGDSGGTGNGNAALSDSGSVAPDSGNADVGDAGAV